jgi:hypothetical protein
MSNTNQQSLLLLPTHEPARILCILESLLLLFNASPCRRPAIQKTFVLVETPAGAIGINVTQIANH